MSRRHYTYEADWRPYAFPEESAGFSTEEELRAAYTPVRLEAGGDPSRRRDAHPQRRRPRGDQHRK